MLSGRYGRYEMVKLLLVEETGQHVWLSQLSAGVNLWHHGLVIVLGGERGALLLADAASHIGVIGLDVDT